MAIHFEELWEQCENFYKDTNLISNVPNLLEELTLKINLYKAMDKSDLPKEEQQKAKSRLLGEILLTLTGLSFKDNVDVYEALAIAFQYRNTNFSNQKNAI